MAPQHERDIFKDRIPLWRLVLGIPLLLIGGLIAAIFTALSVLGGGVDTATLEVLLYALPFLGVGAALCFFASRRVLDARSRTLILEKRLLAPLHRRRLDYDQIERLVCEDGALYAAVKNGERLHLARTEPEPARGIAERHGLSFGDPQELSGPGRMPRDYERSPGNDRDNGPGRSYRGSRRDGEGRRR